ncbi:MFS transporter [Hyphomicrobium sp. 99]|uniref:MFS transporter n=1 Tax=Hyphomicrobium sp. 99 TaxID=1163419 RepID=UPI0005F8123F|nr:MFS transporter [Hyphomicrobium sp. 99]
MRLLPILAASCFVSSMSMRILDPVVPDISRDLSIDTASVAMLASFFAFPYALAQPVLGALGDGFGKSRIIKIALLIVALCLAASAAAPTFDMLAFARLVGGAAAGGIIPLAFALVGDAFPMIERQIALSRVLTAIIAGNLAGLIGAGFVAAEFGWRISTLTASGLALTALVVTVWGLKPPTPARPVVRARGEFFDGYRAVFANPRSIVCFSAVFVEGIVIFGLFPYVAALLEQRGAGGLKEAGIVLSGFAIGGFIYTFMVRLMLGRLGLYNLIMSGGIISGLGLAMLSLGTSWPAEMAMFVIVGVGFYMIHNSLQTQATELAPRYRASGVAAHSFFVFLGQAFGPLAYGFGLANAGTLWTMVTAGSLMGLLGVVTAWGLKSRAASPVPGGADPART